MTTYYLCNTFKIPLNQSVALILLIVVSHSDCTLLFLLFGHGMKPSRDGCIMFAKTQYYNKVMQ